MLKQEAETLGGDGVELSYAQSEASTVTSQSASSMAESSVIESSADAESSVMSLSSTESATDAQAFDTTSQA
jgi:hypothetical protein